MVVDVGAARRRSFRFLAVAGAAGFLAACQSSSSTHEELAPAADAPIFSSEEYGVAASPRVTNLKRVPKGGGRAQVGKPYKVRGKWYYPKDEPGYVRSGKASWYGSNFHGRLTANGEIYDMYHLSAAHPTFPLPSYARVTNRKNGRSVMVRVNDRGPYAHGRVIDVSSQAAEVLDFRHDGIGDVKVEYVGRAPLEGDDSRMLMASFDQGGGRAIDSGLPAGVMIASNERAAEPRLVASAYVPASNAALPGVKPPLPPLSMSDIIESYDEAAPEALPAPVPTARSIVLSYGAATPLTGASRALAAFSAAAAPAERIAIGSVDDLGLLTRIHDVVEDRGALIEDVSAGSGGVSLAFEPRAGEEVDRILRALWAAGATDAFVVRD